MVMVVALGCTSSSNTTGTDGGGGGSGGSGGSNDCSVTLTGAVSTTAACQAAFETLTGSASSEFGAIVKTLPTGFTSIGASFQVSGMPMAQTYTPADFTAGGASVTTTAQKVYVASEDPVAGTVGSLVVTGVTVAQNTGSATDYYVHGSFTATLAEQGSGSGTVMMVETF
jgi:hypothetical protein